VVAGHRRTGSGSRGGSTGSASRGGRGGGGGTSTSNGSRGPSPQTIAPGSDLEQLIMNEMLDRYVGK